MFFVAEQNISWLIVKRFSITVNQNLWKELEPQRTPNESNGIFSRLVKIIRYFGGAVLKDMHKKTPILRFSNTAETYFGRCCQAECLVTESHYKNRIKFESIAKITYFCHTNFVWSMYGNCLLNASYIWFDYFFGCWLNNYHMVAFLKALREWIRIKSLHRIEITFLEAYSVWACEYICMTNL